MNQDHVLPALLPNPLGYAQDLVRAQVFGKRQILPQGFPTAGTDGTNYPVALIASSGELMTNSSLYYNPSLGTLAASITGNAESADIASTLVSNSSAKKHMDGLAVTYSSATDVIVLAGGARNSSDASEITLSSNTTLSIATTDALNGLDQKTLVATATTHGTATFEPSASVWSETAFTTIVRTGTGTITGGATTITGTGTKFLTELAVGDVIRSTSTGATRVTAVASDTSLTVVAAFPGGSPAGSGFTIYENLNVKIAAEAGQRVNTITHAGTSVVVPSAWASSTSGVTIKVGVEIVSCWYFIYLVTGASGIGTILSTQRTVPFGGTYATLYRFIPTELYNNSSGDITQFYATGTGRRRRVYNSTTDGSRILSAGTATSATTISTATAIPPTADTLIALAFLFEFTLGAPASLTININPVGITTTIQGFYTRGSATTNSGGGYVFVPVGSSGIINYAISTALATGGAYIDVSGWETES